MIFYVGSQGGTFVSLPISGVLADEVNWESVFYFFGGAVILWFIFYVFLCFESPNDHPRITKV